MKIEKIRKESFTVIGKEGSTDDGAGFIQRLWDDANGHFDQVADLAKRDENGDLAGVWGTMSDFSRSFSPWKYFKEGLYLAGIECTENATAPEGWTKWLIPGYVYLKAECDGENTFTEVMNYMKQEKIDLAGAIHDFTCPPSGKNYMYFPIERLN